MLKVEMTPQLLGFKVTGDYDDLDELYDAVYMLMVDDEDFPTGDRPEGDADEQMMSTRLLALCYDLRKAKYGSRNVEFVHSGLFDELAEWHGVPLVEKNVVYSVDIVYPEAMFELLALNYLIEKRRTFLHGSGQRSPYDPDRSLLDPAICAVRRYQSLLLAAVEKEATSGRFDRIRNYATTGFLPFMARMYSQWLDILDCDWANMTRKQRLENMSTIVRDIAEHRQHPQYLEMKNDIDAFVRERGTCRENCEIPDLDWPNPLEW